MTNFSKPIGLLGGTFDPIHHGHLRLAVELYELLDLAEVRLIVSAQPPHREPPAASPELRLAMLQAAIMGIPGLTADDRELHRPGPSYMVNTLRSLRLDYPQIPLYLILGMDAFMGLSQWYEWQQIITLTNLLVVQRPGKLFPTVHKMRDFLLTHQPNSHFNFATQQAGVVLVQEIPELTISATQIRALLAAGRNPCYLLPGPVLEMIYQHKLYSETRFIE